MAGIYGIQTKEVQTFITELESIPWFANIGRSSPWDEHVERASLDTLAQTHEAVNGNESNPYMHWGNNIVDAESKLESLVFDHKRMDEEQAIIKTVRIPDKAIDEFFESLLDEYEGYYGESSSYIHELIEPPHRLIRGAAIEVMLSDVGPEHFFRDFMLYFRAGFWPCGWIGDYPSGKLMLF
jgi:hypothetical protein